MTHDTNIYPLSLHIFRRDLRLNDNTAFLAACQASDHVMPCFIFDKRQINHDYFSKKAFGFLLESLIDLNEKLEKAGGKLYFFVGNAEKIVSELLTTLPIKSVFFNRDYTPFSLKRDAAIDNICKKKEVDCHVYADALLHEPEEVLKDNHKPYTIFTPFFRRAQTLHVAPPAKLAKRNVNFYTKPCSLADNHALKEMMRYADFTSYLKGGRNSAKTLLKKISQFKNYQTIRNFPALSGTTHLSAHHKFGTVSVREVYQVIRDTFSTHHTLIMELYWRDFFTHIAFHFPYVMTNSFHQQYDKIKWHQSKKYLSAWQAGMTGFPIVDAGMRELNETGYMHNRVRMVVASFLVKDLLLDWHLGEQYFAQQLIDYDPAVNNGNWQWAASTGCDAQPYFRIFNPWLQQKKFDDECEYIKKWVPELTSLTAKEIHDPLSTRRNSLKDYVAPIVNHAEQSTLAKALYKEASQL